MKLYTETTAFDFLVDGAWDVDDELLELVQSEGKVDEFNALAEEVFPDGATEEGLNDWLRDEQPILRALRIEEDGDGEED